LLVVAVAGLEARQVMQAQLVLVVVAVSTLQCQFQFQELLLSQWVLAEPVEQLVQIGRL
jgi:hypothetical protein